MRSGLLVLLAIAPAAWCQAAGQDERSAIEVIDECGSSAAEGSIGLTALEEKCPGLTRALEQSGYLALLSTASRDGLNAYDLTDLLQLDYLYEEAAPRDVEVGTLGTDSRVAECAAARASAHLVRALQALAALDARAAA